ncbi:mediator of RNA polymerase II transcription subunit 25-like isoform X8 [Zingiber officinale]|uniref:mediator of RNA polymerase II transcription subunit 25-like isoform X8 n=1 Tax=Zingiber officinale TaxID=94328 RepID=UPI001C4BCC39|nr:mediator of RNA polymerase II transcription subunit 25-like isoform X8 [Zingiber officinale]
MAEKQLIVVVEGTAALGPYWQTIRNDYLEKIIRCYYGNELTGQKLNGTNPEFALVVFNTHGPYNDIVVQRSGWTKDLDIFLQWLSTMCFSGGGFSEAAIAEGLSEALMMLLVSINASDNHQSPEVQKHCVLVAASNPYPLPTPVYRPPISSLEHKENTEVQKESFLADAETVAKSFSQGKKNPHAADPSVDHSISSQGIGKIDGSSTVPISGLPATANPSVNGTIMPRQPITVGSIPTATVKVEPATVSSMVSGPGFSHISSITNVPSQGVSNLQNSSPSHSSQEMNANIDTTQEIKPLLNPLSQPLRPAVPAPANVNILNTISQHRTPVAVHMSNMISSGMASSAHSAISSVSGSGQPMAVTQVTQNSPLGSLASVTSNLGGNSSIGIPPTLNTLQGNMTIGLSASNVGQGTLTSGAQISQVGITINQNMMNNLVSSSVSSGPGTMIPTPGMSQQAGSHSLEIANNTAINMPLVQQTSNIQQSQSKYVKIWEGQLSGQRQGQPVFICRLEGYRSQTASDSFVARTELVNCLHKLSKALIVNCMKRNSFLINPVAADWPSVMQIVRLIAQEHMNNKQYVGNADFLVFRTLNQHGFLGQLQEKKLCAVIQLPSQTLLLSVSDKAGRLIGMLFPGDMVVFKPQVPSQQQQLQQLQPQSQSHLHLQQQHMQQQQLQQQAQQHQHLQVQQPAQQQQQQQPQQIVGAGISQTFIQGHGRSQIMTQGRLPQAGPTNLPGGFLP